MHLENALLMGLNPVVRQTSGLLNSVLDADYTSALQAESFYNSKHQTRVCASAGDPQGIQVKQQLTGDRGGP